MESLTEKQEYSELSYKLTRIMAGYWSLSDFLVMFQMGVTLVIGVYWASLGTTPLEP